MRERGNAKEARGTKGTGDVSIDVFASTGTSPLSLALVMSLALFSCAQLEVTGRLHPRFACAGGVVTLLGEALGYTGVGGDPAPIIEVQWPPFVSSEVLAGLGPAVPPNYRLQDASSPVRVVFDMETCDPDDFLTLLWLCGHPSVHLVAVTVTPGAPDQLGFIRAVLAHQGRTDVVIGAPPDRTKSALSAWHYKVRPLQWCTPLNR